MINSCRPLPRDFFLGAQLSGCPGANSRVLPEPRSAECRVPLVAQLRTLLHCWIRANIAVGAPSDLGNTPSRCANVGSRRVITLDRASGTSRFSRINVREFA